MEKKEPGTQQLYVDTNEVDSDEVWGCEERKVLEVIGLGSGKGFDIRNICLPNDWCETPKLSSEISLVRFEKLCIDICDKWEYNVKKIVVDPNSIIKEIIINNANHESIAHISDDWVAARNGEYSFEGIKDIEPTMIFQEIMAIYLNSRFCDDIDYGYISCDPNKPMGGFGPANLKIPKFVFDFDEAVTDEHRQNIISRKAENIVGRFGLDLVSVKFDEKGLLCEADVDGNSTCLFLSDQGLSRYKYESHNIDNPYQAVALHGIVASFINYLLVKKPEKIN